MTARIVVYSLIHGPDGGKYHREDTHGIPACGIALHRPHRAIAVDDELLCRTCWTDVAEVAS